jgi:hypothetical protein
MRRGRPPGNRAFTDAEIAVAIAAHMAGQSANKAAKRSQPRRDGSRPSASTGRSWV